MQVLEVSKVIITKNSRKIDCSLNPLYENLDWKSTKLMRSYSNIVSPPVRSDPRQPRGPRGRGSRRQRASAVPPCSHLCDECPRGKTNESRCRLVGTTVWQKTFAGYWLTECQAEVCNIMSVDLIACTCFAPIMRNTRFQLRRYEISECVFYATPLLSN